MHSLSGRERQYSVGDGPPASPARVAEALDFDAVYDATADTVYRTLARLGIAPASLQDAVQDVFVVVYRRLGGFEGRSSVKTWVCGIALRVARDYRRAARAKIVAGTTSDVDPDTLDNGSDEGPLDEAVRSERLKLLDLLLGELDDEKRAVFVLAEFEQLTVAEISEALDVNLNTLYSRLRAARQDFEQAVARYQARQRRAP